MPAADLPVALEAARAGAAEVASGLDRQVEVRFKADADPVTEVDHRSETAILDVISRRRPRDPVVGEERGGLLPEEGRVWLVDPLDGTTNFVHGFPWISVSVALWIDNAPSVGVVVDVTTGDEYTAVAGGGAHINGTPIAVSPLEDFGQALIVTGFPYGRRERIEICDTRFRRVLGTVQGVRRLGAASLDMCMVASGRILGGGPGALGHGSGHAPRDGGRRDCERPVRPVGRSLRGVRGRQQRTYPPAVSAHSGRAEPIRTATVRAVWK